MIPVNDNNEPETPGWVERAWWAGLGAIALPMFLLVAVPLVWKLVHPYGQ